jgi:UDP-N-acetylmuramate dehydrogenase
MNQNLLNQLPPTRGRYTENATLGDTSWFRCGGCAEVLYKPADAQDLADFLKNTPANIPVTVLGVCSNIIIRDGGIKGVTIKLGGAFAEIKVDTATNQITAGAAALDINVSTAAARAGLSGLEFLSGIPGSIGGAIHMNAGAYGRETVDALIEAHAISRDGQQHTYTPAQMGMSYRHNNLPDSIIFTSATFKTTPDAPDAIEERMASIRTKRESTQPVRSRTGGSTFANPSVEELNAANLPPDTKTWQLIDKVGGRGLTIGGAQMSELHCNFMLNTGTATSTELEALGEEIRKRVLDTFGVTLRWEIKRIGEQKI